MESEDYLVDGPENKAATIDDLKKVIKLLQKYDVPHILIDGYAMMLQDNQRITKKNYQKY